MFIGQVKINRKNKKEEESNLKEQKPNSLKLSNIFYGPCTIPVLAGSKLIVQTPSILMKEVKPILEVEKLNSIVENFSAGSDLNCDREFFELHKILNKNSN